jgi:two-component system nitrogen regulation response regulator GlnG
MLLRVLETGEIRPLGAAAARPVDVRLLAATDADLERAVASEEFRLPLLHRLSSYELHVPPLRARRDDIGRLLVGFLREELAAVGELERLARGAPESSPWLPAAFVAQLARYSFPGNVRQLRNFARQIAVASRGRDRRSLAVPASITRLIGATAAPASPAGDEPTAPPPAGADRRNPSDIAEHELIDVLRANQWRINATASRLGISRTSLYLLMDRSPNIRKARDIPRDQLAACSAEHGGDLDAMASQLQISKRGLQLRMKELGMAG